MGGSTVGNIVGKPLIIAISSEYGQRILRLHLSNCDMKGKPCCPIIWRVVYTKDAHSECKMCNI